MSVLLHSQLLATKGQTSVQKWFQTKWGSHDKITEIKHPFHALPPDKLNLCILESPKRVLWQTVKTQNTAFYQGLHCFL